MGRSSAIRREWEEAPCSGAAAEGDSTAADSGPAPAACPDERAIAICDRVIDIFSTVFNVPGRELRRPGRGDTDVSRARQIAMYVTHVVLGMTMRDVATGFSRDRTTVVHACHLIEDMRDDPDFDRIVAMAERVVSSAFSGRE